MNPEPSEKLVLFLFLLLRDHLTLGEIAEVLQHINKVTDAHTVTYECQHIPYLEIIAREIAGRLNEPAEFVVETSNSQGVF